VFAAIFCRCGSRLIAERLIIARQKAKVNRCIADSLAVRGKKSPISKLSRGIENGSRGKYQSGGTNRSE